MDISAQILQTLEKGDEDYKAEQLKRALNLRSDRAARVVLNILETSPDKCMEKVAKEIHKLEEKKLKEYKRMQKKFESYNFNTQEGNSNKLHKLDLEINELKRLLTR